MSLFTDAFNHAMLWEVGPHWDPNHPGAVAGLINNRENRVACGYVNRKADRGGETKYGISSKANPDLDIKGLDLNAAMRVYDKRYWTPGDCGDIFICSVSNGLVTLHFDNCVHHGDRRAARFLQTALRVKVDGDIGPETLSALKASKLDISAAILHIREEYCRDIVRNDPTQKQFLDGWLRRINSFRN